MREIDGFGDSIGRAEQGDTSATERRSPMEWWWQLTSPAELPPSASFTERERGRRGRLVSVMLLLALLVEVGALYMYLVVDDDHPAMVKALWVALALSVAAGILNRRGAVGMAGLLLVAVADLPLVGIPATAIGGRIDVLHLPAFYLLAGSVLVAASVLAPWWVFVVAVINSALIDASIVLLPHTPALAQVLASNNAQQVYAGPIVMQGIVALVAYLWASSVHSALRRADRAEEIAELERREAQRRAELEEGVQDLLAVHVRMANGDFNVRVPPVRDALLWRVGASLNNLIARFARLAQMEFVLRRTQTEAQRLAEAIVASGGGRQVVWPAPSGTPVDEVLVALARTSAGAGAGAGSYDTIGPRSGVWPGTGSGALVMPTSPGAPGGSPTPGPGPGFGTGNLGNVMRPAPDTESHGNMPDWWR